MLIGGCSTNRLGVALASTSTSAAAWLLFTVVPALGAQGTPNDDDSRGEVHALGRIQPAAGLVVVGARPGTRILEIKVEAGDVVKEGQVLAILEGRDQAAAQLALAEAEKASADHQRATRKEALAIERAQLDAAHAAKRASAAQIAEILKKKFDESSLLYKTLGATLTGRDKLEADAKYLELQVQSIKAALELSLLDVEAAGFAKQRALEDRRLDPSNPEFQAAARQVESARAGLAQTEVSAPRAGTILDVLARPGEVSSGPLLRMGDVASMVVVAEVYQTDVSRLKIGDAATVDVLGETIRGKTTRIGSIVGRNQIINVDPRALQDLRVVDVTIALDESEPASRLINLEVEAAIAPSGGG